MIDRRAAELSEESSVAREWLDSMRTSLIHSLHEVEFDIKRYKEAAADCANYGVRVRRSDTLNEAMEDAMRVIADLNEFMGEWTS